MPLTSTVKPLVTLTVDNALDRFFSCEGCFENNPAFSGEAFTGRLGLQVPAESRERVNFVTGSDSQVTSIDLANCSSRIQTSDFRPA